MRRLCLPLLAAAAFIAGTTQTAVAATPKPVTFTIVVGKKGVAGGPKKITLKKGTRVVLVVQISTALRAEEVHFHGYDIEREVITGKPVRLLFTARLTGRFALELHLKGGLELPIAEITVR